MTAPKPPPRTLPPAEERKIQLFLERAAAIVLEDPNLSAERLERLSLLADELDLTAEQFRSTLDDLKNRGVIKKMEVVPPKPPPLPGHLAPAGQSFVHESTEDFALGAPGEPPVQAPTKLPAEPLSPTPKPVSGAVSREASGIKLPATPAATPPGAAQEPRLSSAAQAFLQRAAAILAEFQGWNSKSQALLTAAGRDLGLDDSAMQTLLQKLRSADAIGTGPASESARDRLAAGRWRIEGAPAPLPSPPAQSPAETFTDFARPSLAAARDGVVSEELEQRLLAHGTRVLGLSPVYARHLLLDLVAERRMRLASAPDAPPPIAADPAALDPRLQSFLQAAAPILAQHRGLTAQSRMLLTALAAERGLSEGDMEQAITSMNAREPTDTASRIQQERLAALKASLGTQLKKVGRGVLTPALYDKLLANAVESHGVDAELAAAAIRETAETCQLAVVTHEQAQRHLRELLQELLPPGTPPSLTLRERIELEGAQWGVPSATIAELVEQHLQQTARQLAVQERITRWALGSAFAAVVLLIVFFVWAAMDRRSWQTTTGESTSPAPAPRLPRPLPPLPREPSWLDEHPELSIAIVNARSDFPTLRKELSDLAASDPTRRQTAYPALAEHFLQQPDLTESRGLQELLVRSLALDPSDEAAAVLLDELLVDAPEDGKSLQETAPLARLFRGLSTVTAALAFAPPDESRSQQLNGVLQRLTGVAVTSSVSTEEVAKAASAGLAERLFQQLIEKAAQPDADLPALHQAWMAVGAQYVPENRLHRLQADFLNAAFRADSKRLAAFEPLLKQTVQSRDRLAVLELVDLYEETADETLRESLRAILVAVFPGAPVEAGVADVAHFVRQSLGVRDADDPDGTFRRLARDAAGVLKAIKKDEDSRESTLAEILQLSHFSTLACAFAQKAWSDTSVMEFRERGPHPLKGSTDENVTAPTAPATSSLPVTADRETLGRLRTVLSRLTERRSTPTLRLAAMEELTTLTSRMPDLSPEQAKIVAEYLVGSKPSAETERLVQLMPRLSVWDQLLLAVADRVPEAPLPDSQLQAILSAVSSSEILLSDSSESRERARRMLLQLVLQRLTPTSPAEEVAAGPGENTATGVAEAYLLQAKLLGVAIPEDVAKTRNPANILARIIETFSTEFPTASVAENQRTELRRIPHELVAAEFVARNDVERLVLLERIWLRLLALEAARRQPSRSAEAVALVQAHHQQSHEARQLVSQLRDGQAKQLEMWLLIAKPG